MSNLTWEEAVRWYRAQPGNEEEVRNNYFDLPPYQAAERYAASEEFREVVKLLGTGEGRHVLDLGAGNGIASFALARQGWIVTAVEPDPSDEVGAGAIRTLALEAALPIKVVQQFSEKLPFEDDSFDAIHARQVLHHVPNLETMIQELHRVLRRGGFLLSTREHVADDEHQLEAFRNEHPLHHLYGGENAYPVAQYLSAFTKAGFELVEFWGPVQSILNFFPGTENERRLTLRQIANHSCFRLGRLAAWSSTFRDSQVRRFTKNDRTPGRIYSFLLRKP